MTDADFIQFAEGMDRCWRENRFHDLDTFLADDVIVVAPDGQTRLEGIAAVYGECVSRTLHHFRLYGDTLGWCCRD